VGVGVCRAAAGSPSYSAPTSSLDGGSRSAASPALRWPGEAPRLVDLFGFREAPAGQVDAILAALRGCEAAAQPLPPPLQQAAGGVAPSSGMSAADVEALRAVLDTYVHVNRTYDQVAAGTCRGCLPCRAPGLPLHQPLSSCHTAGPCPAS
jgi:hypothetical protein